MKTEVKTLADIFARLGADDPEGWAQSQVSEGIPQLHRFLALRQFWSAVVSEDDQSWIDQEILQYQNDPEAPFAGGGRALLRMLDRGVARADIVDLVRAMQAQLLFDICYKLDDPSFPDDMDDAVDDIGWTLVATDENGEPTGTVIDGLHESALEMDPTRREMRPRPE